MPRSHEEDIAARVARRLGLEFTETVVLNSGTNVLVHLTPAPVVARVTRLAHLIRPITDLAGAIALARSKALSGRVAAPTTLVDPGPHVEDSRYVTLWTYYPGGPTTPLATPVEAGSSLRLFHESARSHAGPLRSFDPRPEAMKISDLVEPGIGTLLRSIATSMTAPDRVQQPIHGDAHVENALAGGIWQDFDEACAGPIEWDLACLQHRRYLFGERQAETAAALSAYGPHDLKAVEILGPLVALWIAAWGSLAPLIGEQVGPRTRLRLEWLREHYG
jgi:hypothetical protein